MSLILDDLDMERECEVGIGLDILVEEVEAMLTSLRLKTKAISIVKNISVQFVAEDFGTVVCCIDRCDYTVVHNALLETFEGWRIIYITTYDDLFEKRKTLIWELMKSGYMVWIRETYFKQFKDLIVMNDFGKGIIEERLRLWNNNPKYKYMIDRNTEVLDMSFLYVLNNEPCFFDYMPDIDI